MSGAPRTVTRIADFTVSYKVYGHAGWGEGLLGVDFRATADSNCEIADEGSVVVSGRIKRDGCADLNFFPDDGGYAHLCGQQPAARLGELLNGLYALAKEQLGGFG